MAALTPYLQNALSVIDAAEAQIKASQAEMERPQGAPPQENQNVTFVRRELKTARKLAEELRAKIAEMDRKGSDIPTRTQLIRSVRVDYACWVIRYLQSLSLPASDPMTNHIRNTMHKQAIGLAGSAYTDSFAHAVMGTKPLGRGLYFIPGEKM